MARTKSQTGARPVRRPASAAWTAGAQAAGLVVTVAALLVGAVLAVIFAATLALVTVLASTLLGLAALAWRAQPRPAIQGAVAPVRPGGHAWVAYEWNRPPR